MIDRILRSRKKPLGCVVTLPGRDGTGKEMVELYKQSGLTKSLIVGVTPPNRQWYPLPNGAGDQKAAVSGIDAAVVNVFKTLSRIRRNFGITSRNTALAGFSAGAVVALQVAARSEHPFAAVLCHSGAILEPDKLPPCKHPSTKILLIHSRDDTCFYWEERYLPMKAALKAKGYNFMCLERDTGNHGLYRADMIVAGMFLSPLFGYKKIETDAQLPYDS